MRKALALGTAAASLSGLALAAPASAACTDDALNVCSGTTTVAFTVDAGTIAIATTPAASSATQALTGATTDVTASLGLTTVTDTRISGSGWSVSASAGTFTGTDATTIPGSAASFFVPAAPISVLGGHTLARTATTAADAVAGGAALVTSTGAGVNTATFVPSVKVNIPTGTTAVAFTGTVTQSVA